MSSVGSPAARRAWPPGRKARGGRLFITLGVAVYLGPPRGHGLRQRRAVPAAQQGEPAAGTVRQHRPLSGTLYAGDAQAAQEAAARLDRCPPFGLLFLLPMGYRGRTQKRRAAARRCPLRQPGRGAIDAGLLARRSRASSSALPGQVPGAARPALGDAVGARPAAARASASSSRTC